MSNLQSRALENEFCDIARELGGDVEGKAAGDAYLAASHPVTDGSGSSTWAITPKVLGPAEVGILREGAETFGRILEKVTAHYLDDASFRALFRLPEQVEKNTLIPTGYEQILPFVRLDTLFDQQTGSFRFCGVATTTAGMTAAVDVTRAVQLTEAYRRFSELHPSIETFDVVGGVIAALRETYISWANADTGAHHPEFPAVGIVDYPESASSAEFADLIERLSEEGVYARFVDIRDLRIEEAGGQRRLVDSEGPISCVYRRATMGEMFVEKPCAGAEALAEAARRGLACLIGGFSAWPAATSAIFAVLHSDAAADLLTSEELAFVRAHVPEAHFLERGCDLAPYLAEQGEWLVRPAGGYRASEAVAGVDRMDRDEWWRVLLAACEEGAVIERLDPAGKTPVVVGGAAGGEVAEGNTMLGLYLCRGEFAGVYARCGFESVMGEWGRRVDLGCIVVSD